MFSDLGRTLQSILNDGLHLLREKAAFQLVVRLVGREPVLPKTFSEETYNFLLDLSKVF